MNITVTRRVAVLVLTVSVGLAGCASAAPPRSTASPTSAATEAETPLLADVVVTVSSSESCGCCKEWVAYLEELGADVEVTYPEDLRAFKQSVGVPEHAWSCHTAAVEGYVVEGHVPAQAIVDLLAERPGVAGIALPGMPSGSPGMPGDGIPLEVLTFVDGETRPFGTY